MRDGPATEIKTPQSGGSAYLPIGSLTSEPQAANSAGPKGRDSLAQPSGLGAERPEEFHFQRGLKGCDRGGRAMDL